MKDTINRVEGAISDTAITSIIKAKYLADSEVSALKIKVETDHGEVLLSGNVPSEESAEHAITLAEDTNATASLIACNFSATALATTSAKVTDESSTVKNVVSDSAITAAVKSKFIADSDIKSLSIHVETVNGKVTLIGQVPSAAMKEKAIDIAKNSDGVAEVISKLTVK
ncbi:transport-associated protein [Reticulomyxa filosa]|uniref:Transport-associated protein n=1 Tax=Reticulomyxa filosa TaxID=46433 RepID=X6LB41_RETFI|nr:transport-associated protein [Reticulomyxa filosa]|eukprot:ETN98758.1 transport-associated protein [Reticulomyxa filosa]